MSMIGLLTRLLIGGLSVAISAYVLPGVTVDSFFTAIIVSLAISIVNTIVKPILVILTLPITIITFGLFLIVINTLLVLFVSSLVPGFHITHFFNALLFSIVLSLVQSVLRVMTK